jgi:DNA-binding transcriptional ArsR family regulator
VWHYLHVHADTQVDAVPAQAHHHDVVLDAASAHDAAEVFRLLSDPTRLSLVWHLMARERSVNELAQLVGRPPPGVSQHLARLRTSGLVTTRRDGTTVHYRLADDHVGRLVVDALSHAQHADGAGS